MFTMELDTIWWLILYAAFTLFVCNLFFYFYYQSIKNEEESVNKGGLVKAGVFLGTYLFVSALVYFRFNKTFNKVEVYTVDLINLDLSEKFVSFTVTVPESSGPTKFFFPQPFISLGVTFFYLICCFAFSITVSAGMALLPFALFNYYKNRPQKPDPKLQIITKKMLVSKAEDLMIEGKNVYSIKRDMEIHPDENQEAVKTKTKILHQRLNELKEDLIDYNSLCEEYEKQENILEENPLFYFTSFILSIVCFILSFIFFFHIILSVKRFNFILESIFSNIKDISPLFSTAFFLIFSIYVFCASLYGFYKVMILFKMDSIAYPFKRDETWADTFLLYSTVSMISVIGFCAMIMISVQHQFSDTDAYFIFMKTLKFNNVIEIITRLQTFEFIFILLFLSCIITYLFFDTPTQMLNDLVQKKQKEIDEEKEKLANSNIE